MIKRKEVIKLLELDSLSPGQKSNLLDCKTLDLTKASSLLLTARATYNPNATGVLYVMVVTSPDDSVYDTQTFADFQIDLHPGKECQSSCPIEAQAAYVKVILENQDPTCQITDIDVWATVGYEE